MTFRFPYARERLALLARGEAETVFDLKPHRADALFRKAKLRNQGAALK